MLIKSTSALFFLVIPTLCHAFFNRGIDVEGRILASATTSEAYYSILGSSSGASYSRLSNPEKKIDVYAEPTNWKMPWGSALFKVSYNCSTNQTSIKKISYFTEKNGKGKELPAGMINTQRDITNFMLPVNVIQKVYMVACVY